MVNIIVNRNLLYFETTFWAVHLEVKSHLIMYFVFVHGLLSIENS